VAASGIESLEDFAMKKDHVIRAWRDEEYRRSLSAEERAMLPEHPAGALTDLDDEVLSSLTGGCGTWKDCGNTTWVASCEPDGSNTCI
jgi:mersacidin/lichenicidin family type 2 lantibiotic